MSSVLHSSKRGCWRYFIPFISHSSPVIVVIQHCKQDCKEHVRRMKSDGIISKNDKVLTCRKKVVRRASKKIQRFCFIIPGSKQLIKRH